MLWVSVLRKERKRKKKKKERKLVNSTVFLKLSHYKSTYIKKHQTVTLKILQ